VTISRDSAVPAYQQIAADLRAAISAGQYPVGSRLPVERELARQYGVTAMTVRHGLDVLRAEGVIESREKRGHFIASLPAAGAGAAPDRDQDGDQAAVMAELRELREDLRRVQQRLDRLEARTQHPAEPGS
jgi:GntR family transcriptional regulator